jgi:hypothetical protein
MPKSIELPPAVAKAFVRDMQAFFAAGGSGVRADAIAAQQLHALKQHYRGKLKLTDVKEMFVQMKGSPVTIEWERPRETKTEEELATILREDLRKVDGCPKRVVSVTVYGIPWKAILMLERKLVRSTTRQSRNDFSTSSSSDCSDYTTFRSSPVEGPLRGLSKRCGRVADVSA